MKISYYQKRFIRVKVWLNISGTLGIIPDDDKYTDDEANFARGLTEYQNNIENNGATNISHKMHQKCLFYHNSGEWMRGVVVETPDQTDLGTLKDLFYRIRSIDHGFEVLS